jgi:hypothetical protein
LTRYQRTDRALVAAVAEACPAGTSTRKVERVARKMGVEHLSKDQVSAIARDLDADVEELPSRDLGAARTPYLWLDATYVKCRREGRVASTAVVTAIGCDEHGRWHVQPGVRDVREVLPQGPPASPGRPSSPRTGPSPARRPRGESATSSSWPGGPWRRAWRLRTGWRRHRIRARFLILATARTLVRSVPRCPSPAYTIFLDTTSVAGASV